MPEDLLQIKEREPIAQGRNRFMLRMFRYVPLLFANCAIIMLAQESLLIGPGDQIHVQVFDTPDMDQHPRVTDSGRVPLLFIGDVKVSGLTPGAAARLIEDTLKEKQFMLHPHVAVTVEDYGTEQVSVMGEVKSAGAYKITAPVSILSVLAMAGGLDDLADRHITVERHGDPNLKMEYFISNTSNDALAAQILVNPGDTVIVPRAGVVYVLGDVGKPGGFAMSTNNSKITLLQALALAGTANKTALLSRAKLLRKGQSGTAEVPIQLGEIEKGKAPDIEMQQDDILYVPSSWFKNVSLGAGTIAAAATQAIIYHP